MKHLCVFSALAISIALCIEHDFKGFDDTILFSINWPGASQILENTGDGETNNSKVSNKEVLKVSTSHKEKYECLIPELQTKEASNIEEYDGPSPLSYMAPLFTYEICSYRLESYWSYEVCHGRYIRQYHDERDGKQVKTQEFFLGRWSPEKEAKLKDEMKKQIENNIKPKMTKVEGLSLPYFEMIMDDGTMCDLNGKPRKTRVLYVCYPHGRHEVSSFKETSTCEYEIVILSVLICQHPHFKPKDVSENTIDCIQVGDAPKKPRSLLKMEVDSWNFQHQSMKYVNNDREAKDVLAVLKVEKIEKDGETHLKLELQPLSEDEDTEDTPKLAGKVDKALESITDDSPVRAFLNGENCLNGGTGWWKYEFCYGKHVTQYHVGRGGKTSLLLGKFDEEAHLNWIKENKGKAPKPLDQRTSVSHFYSGGDLCDKTGKPRQTEVKLKCFENSSSPAQVSLYLLEPRTCHYLLGVESPLICDILPLADENGLIRPPKTKKKLFKDTVIDKDVDNDAGVVKDKDLPKLGND